MPAPEYIEGRRVVDTQDEFKETQAPANTSGTLIHSYRTRPGFQGYIIALRMAWESGGDRNITVRHKVNGGPVRGYESTTVQLTPPEQDYYLPRPIPLEQNSFVEVYADNADAGNAYYVTTRSIIAYTEVLR